MEIEDKELYTCKEIGAYLDKPPMAIGRLRNEVCTARDISGKMLKKSGLQKVLDHLKVEMDIIESGMPDIVEVQVVKKFCKSPRHFFALDLERKQGCAVLIPARDKERLARPGSKLRVERVSMDANFKYQWTRQTPKLAQGK